MPNHVTTTMVVTGPNEDVDTFKRAHIRAIDKHGKVVPHFDFDTVFPMPPFMADTRSPPPSEIIAAMVDRFSFVPVHTLQRYKHGLGPMRGRDFIAWLTKNRPDEIAAARLACRALAETGCSDWYEWNIAHWGTKWGAYAARETIDGHSRYGLRFETAWSFPEPIFVALAERYPTLVFDCATYDEGDCFGGVGQFNGRRDFRAAQELATPETYLLAYGRKKPTYDDDGNEVEEAVAPPEPSV